MVAERTTKVRTGMSTLVLAPQRLLVTSRRACSGQEEKSTQTCIEERMGGQRVEPGSMSKEVRKLRICSRKEQK